MRWPRPMVFAVSLLSLVLIVGCAAARAPENVAPDRGVAESAPSQPPPSAAPATGSTDAYGQVPSAVSNQTDQMIIQTVTMSVIVEDTDQTLQGLRELVGSHEGYIADSSRWLVDDQPYANVTIRVPAASLDAVLEAIAASAITVVSQNQSSQDVTEEYVDLQARLRNLEATEVELRTLLTEVRENQGKAEEILAIYRELTTIRGEIESLKGRTQYLERLTALATIQLEIRPKAAPQPLVEKSTWNPLITINRAARGFVGALQIVVDLGIYVLMFSPFVLVPIALLWLLARAVRRRKRAVARP